MLMLLCKLHALSAVVLLERTVGVQDCVAELHGSLPAGAYSGLIGRF